MRIVFLVSCVLGVIFLFVLYRPASTMIIRSPVGAEASVEQVIVSDPLIGKPLTLYIPALSVNAPIQAVGKAASGAMGTPQGVNKFREVGWYKFGPRPGQQGSAVIDGHLDNALSLKGVFYHLDQLKIGDEVSVQTDEGEQVFFRVTQVRTYDYKDASTDEVFISNDGKAHLNLITCEGAWVQREKSYDQRLVVFTDLISIAPAGF